MLDLISYRNHRFLRDNQTAAVNGYRPTFLWDLRRIAATTVTQAYIQFT